MDWSIAFDQQSCNKREKGGHPSKMKAFIPLAAASLYLWLMQLNDDLIDKLSQLSMLRFEAAEKEMIRIELQQMIGFIDKLRELDTTGVEPLLHLTAQKPLLREDITGGTVSRTEALRSAAANDDTFFLLPKTFQKPGTR